MAKRTEAEAAYREMTEQGKAFDIGAIREAFAAPTGNLYALLEHSYLATITPDISAKTLSEELAKGASPVYVVDSDIRNWARVYEQFSYLGGATAQSYLGGVYRLNAMVRVANFLRSHGDAAQTPDERVQWLRKAIELSNADLRDAMYSVRHADPQEPKNLFKSTWDTLKRVRDAIKARTKRDLGNNALIMGLVTPLDGDQPEHIAAQYELLANIGDEEESSNEPDDSGDEDSGRVMILEDPHSEDDNGQ